jgi:sulfonate transport system substrate-binding protein
LPQIGGVNQTDQEEYMPSTKRLNRSLIAGALIFVATAAAQAEPLTIRLGYFEAPADLGPLLFAQKDVLKHYGKSYTIEATHFVGSSLAVTALAANQIDIAPLATPAVGLAIQNAGLSDLRIFADEVQDGVDGYYTSQSMVRADSPIKTVEDLKHKVVATPAVGAAVDIDLRIMLRRHHLEADRDYSIVQVQPPNMKAMLMQGKADLVTVSQPYAFDEELLKMSRVLFTRRDVTGGATETIFWGAREAYLKDHRDAIIDLTEDILRATRWYAAPENRAKTVAVLAEATKQPAAILNTWVFTNKDHYRNLDGIPNLDAIQQDLVMMKEMGFLKTDIDVKKYTDLSLVEEADRRLK